jgi:hypothetical protein
MGHCSLHQASFVTLVIASLRILHRGCFPPRKLDALAQLFDGFEPSVKFSDTYTVVLTLHLNVDSTVQNTSDVRNRRNSPLLEFQSSSQ